MATSSSSFVKYGYEFPAGTEELEVEFWCLQQGREWIEKQGRTLFSHYVNCHRLLWPEDSQHRWFNQMLKSFCDEEITVLLGCGDSAKTYGMSCFALIDYWAFPQQTLWMVSSTEYRGCELRIWGEIKMLFNRAKDRYPWLAGHPLESMHAITTDEIDDDRQYARSLKTGLILVPCKKGSQYVGLCFVAGTLVDTPDGKKRIEDLKVGDSVISAIGQSKVRHTSNRAVDRLVRLHFDNGTFLECTPEHPFLTSWGWQNAVDISPDHRLISPHEALHYLREGMPKQFGKKEILLQGVPSVHLGEEVPMVPKNIYPVRSEGDFLFEVLWSEMEDVAAGDFEKGHGQQGLGCDGKESESDNHGQSRRTETSQPKRTTNAAQSRQTKDGIRSRNSNVGTRNDYPGHVSGSKIQSSCSHGKKLKTRKLPTLLDGLFLAGNKAECGNRRILPQFRSSKIEGQDSGRFPKTPRVVRVEILPYPSETESDTGEAGYRVYNVEIAGHPSFSVSGLLVHNSAFQGVKAHRLRHAGDEVAAMEEGFLNAYTNWYGKRDFKGLMAGNPTDPEDQLCRAAEPMEGWDHFVDTGKTQEWRSKFFNAHVIALDGRDSPNNDFPDSKLPKYHFLISRKKLDAVAATYGTDSWQWYSQCIGKPNKSVLLFRVITRQQCLENHALEEVVWIGESLTSVYALDPNYGGQDRCVGGKIDFGKDVDGNEIISFHAPEIIPIKPAINPGDREPEAQIARHVKLRLEEYSIPAKNCFYDATGKGTLGFAFAKEFGALCPVPIDSGAKATTRPVRFDLFVEEKNKQRRLKRCDEHYNKFVTEMWFSVSEAILSGQIRGLPMDVMKELCLRTYSIGKGNHIEIEPKSGTPNKPGFIQRIGYSPDLGDWAAFCVEGARRLGFQIKRLGNDLQSDDDGFNWLEEWQSKHEKLLRSRELTRT